MLLVFPSAFNVARGDSVQYEVTFDGTWSQSSHPLNFPPSPHFSGLIGGTHNANARFWELGGLATPGIESMAETGSKSTLTGEVSAAITDGTAQAIISGGGIGRSPDSVRVNFTADADFPLVSLVSMIAPSPDWFVGVSGLNLIEADHWRRETIVPLLPYDAGTDSGLSFTSPNADTNPQEPIFVITDGSFRDAPFVGTFTFRLTTGDLDISGSHTSADIDLLSQAILDGSNDLMFDLNRDGTVGHADRTYLIERLFGTLPGDANLDLVVDGSDFNLWNDHRGSAADWATGDFNGDFLANDADFELLAANLFAPVSTLNISVPEPSGLLLSWFGVAFWTLTAGRRAVRFGVS